MMKKNILQIKDYLNELFPSPKCELQYNKDYELVIAVMLSARTTDKGVNKATNILFSKYDSLEKLSQADAREVKEIIKSLGNYNKKAFNIIEISKKLLKEFNGNVPRTHTELESLNGIGRKCANVILGELYDIPSFAVDTHVTRVSKRLSLTKNDKPFEIEKDLMKIFPKNEWTKLHKQLVLFGRYYCKSQGANCLNCKLKDICHK